MPLELDYVISDAKHYGPFVCKLCNMLISYTDAVVTSPCSHAFCFTCLETWVRQESENSSNPCTCPSCPTEIEQDDTSDESTTMMISNLPICAQRLSKAQPLAYLVLGQIQVSCTNMVHGDAAPATCGWAGDYSQLHDHDHQPDGSGPGAIATPTGTTNNGTGLLNGITMPQPPALSFDDARRSTHRGEITGAHHHRNVGNGVVKAFNPQDLVKASERCDKLKKQANAKFNRGDVEGARLLYSEGLALIAVFPIENDEVRKLTASLYSNRAVTYFRERILEPSIEDCNKSLELDPIQEKTYIRKWRALTALGSMEDAMECLQDGVAALPNSRKLAEELAKAKDAPPPAPASVAPSVMDMSVAVSVASRSVYTSHPSKGGELDRAEKLKKQANAKFNKGDIESARALYTEALNCIPGSSQINNGVNVEQVFSPEVRDLMAMLYSNRAVTFYRDKQFRESLADCEKAVKLDTRSEKSYIRKSRALAGLELHEEACKCLEEALKILTNSKKITDELEKAQDKLEEDMIRAQNGMGNANDENMSVAGFTVQGIHNVQNKDFSEDLDLADKLKRNANAKFNRGDIAGARLLYTEALACLPNNQENPEIRACLASLYANRAVTFFREKEFDQSVWDCDKAIQLDPKSEKSYIRKARALVSISRADEAVDCLEEGMLVVANPGRLEEELSKAREQLQMEDNAFDNGLSEQQRNDFMVSSQNLGYDGNDDDQFFVSPARPDKRGLGSVAEGHTEEYNIPYSSDEDLERADKIKKQANAKLNKGDVAGARMLYAEGLACLPAGGPQSEDGRELAASLYANRAVTFFREKKFAATVSDCDKSLELDPKHEKSYIRKWRALMALGNFEGAFSCLKQAVDELPDSERLTDELENAKEQKELLNTINRLIDSGEYQEARNTLKPLVKTSDNVTLWLIASRVDACLGLTESALERVSKVLMFNPRNNEAQQVKGYALFLTGDMETGISSLRDALDAADEETPAAIQQLELCQQTFASFSKGQARVKRGRYKEAVDLFSASLEDGIEIPREAPLYGLLLTERAEASLLAQLYEESLEDCNEAIELKYDNMTAWTVKIEVYFALGRLEEARGELAQVRKSWGAGNETIEEAYKKTDFEMRLQRADDELHKLVESIDAGLPEGNDRRLERRPSRSGIDRRPPGRKGSSTHNLMNDRESGSERRSRKAKSSKRSSSTSRRKDRKPRPSSNENDW